MHVVVLGAGVIGTTTAYYLRQQGHDVTVIERQSAAGLETSFANGGQIAPSGATPWGSPEVPLLLLRWLGKVDAPLRLRLRALPGLPKWFDAIGHCATPPSPAPPPSRRCPCRARRPS